MELQYEWQSFIYWQVKLNSKKTDSESQKLSKMKVEQKGHTTIIKDTQGDINSFLVKVTNELNAFKTQNLILDVTSNKNVTLKDIKLFAEVSKTHRKNKKSFVIVANEIDFNAVPAKMTVVPSQLEAHDIIEMEEIERDLGF